MALLVGILRKGEQKLGEEGNCSNNDEILFK
jgi:hypothetical protein